jgi:diaminohydroxyphosphoribosylaminopyrimidine deaminase/5-amino-6-(5-phosphoribosylamino)uracil reductase
VAAKTEPDDAGHMMAALGLAARGLGNVWPNPAVGCVLVGAGRVLGRGWTQPGGRPHAESEALRRAGADAHGATAYVTLEPCAHRGETEPCADALVAAGIDRAVVALQDPDPRVAGRGIDTLRGAGIAIECGGFEDEAAQLNAGYLCRLQRGRPLVTLKTATTLDGRIATGSGKSQWITGEAARARAHRLRAEHDAVLIGVGTAIADDPELSCRLPGLTHASPLRIIADGALRTPLTAKLVRTASTLATWIVTVNQADADRRKALTDHGVEMVNVAADGDGRPDLTAAMEALGARGLTRVLVEGGGELAAALLRADLVDRVAWFHAPKVMGGEGIPAALGLGVEAVDEAPDFRRVEIMEVGEDVFETYARET